MKALLPSSSSFTQALEDMLLAANSSPELLEGGLLDYRRLGDNPFAWQARQYAHSRCVIGLGIYRAHAN